jgi:polyisoprenoid-binding protein YceI
MTGRRRWLRWVVAGAVAVVVLAVGVPFAYIHFIEGPAPKPLSLNSSPGHSASPGGSPAGGSAAGGASAVSGTWRAGVGSVVGYRVDEVLVGQNNVAVGRTSSVTGDLVVAGSAVKSAAFTVRMATIRSDQSERDVQFDGRIMDVAAYPTGAFTLTRPIPLAPVPAVGQVRSYQATGNLTLHGHTKPVTFTLSAERTSAGLRISGSIPVKFADWDIPNPSFGTFVTTANHGILEFLLAFVRAG